jgi:uncharacterized protein (DUF2235 family)
MMSSLSIVEPASASPIVRKRLVFCCDGTWNTATERSNGVLAPTNVRKVFEGLVNDYDKQGSLVPGYAGTPQMVMYQPGVGTARLQHLRGGGFGLGLSQHVREVYGWIVDNYEPGDELCFFGFSRGAYTARSAIGLVHQCGIVRRDTDIRLTNKRLRQAYRLYKSRRKHHDPTTEESKRFRQAHSFDDVEIDFVGVWDTVGALGIPIPGLPIPECIKHHWSFHGVTLNPHVRCAYQALAIDERRGPFEPALWREEKSAPATQEVQQVWFAGCHRDVGGGQAIPDLSEIPLRWMVERAINRGMKFKGDYFRVVSTSEPAPAAEDRQQGKLLHPNPLATIDDSLTGIYKRLPRTRSLGSKDTRGRPAVGESVASSAKRRVETSEARYVSKSVADWVAGKKAITGVNDGMPSP